MSTKQADHVELFKEDTLLQAVVRQVQLPGWTSTENVFHDVMSCIIEQQIHYRSSKNVFMYAMMEAGLDELKPGNFHLLEPALSKLRLSEAKYEAMAKAVEFFSQTVVKWDTLPDQEVRLQLSAVKGIGVWTVDMILLYTLRRRDVFPKDDYHLAQIMTKVYGLDPSRQLKKEMVRISERWENNRSLGVLYLLAYKDHLLKRRKKVE